MRLIHSTFHHFVRLRLPPGLPPPSHTYTYMHMRIWYFLIEIRICYNLNSFRHFFASSMQLWMYLSVLSTTLCVFVCCFNQKGKRKTDHILKMRHFLIKIPKKSARISFSLNEIVFFFKIMFWLESCAYKTKTIFHKPHPIEILFIILVLWTKWCFLTRICHHPCAINLIVFFVKHN